MEKYPSLADQNWQKSLEIPQCERPRSRGKIPIARGSKLAKIAGNPTVRAKNTHRSRGKIPIARVEKYPSLAWKNTHRSRGKININSVQESTSIVRQNQYIAFLKKMRYN
ncbi:hypothetical protein [Microcoleus sp. PH2017_31_RDM_U_A]|uniref:hypothetical protein n=1 Tax=Microcoleus sp. PH2017_31_RDM_U_A TaxID=2798841 RepID=UPI0025F4D368|nr:hypothetical protein [Microcoleus sp. PH2017_31_RDM_U_A]